MKPRVERIRNNQEKVRLSFSGTINSQEISDVDDIERATSPVQNKFTMFKIENGINNSIVEKCVCGKSHDICDNLIRSF